MYDLQSVSVCTVLPYVRLEDSSNGELPFLDGTAILYRTKVVRSLDGQQTRILLLLMNQLGQAVFAPEPSDKEKLQAVSLKISHCQSAIEPVLVQKSLMMEIHVKMEAEIGEIDGEQDVFKPDKIIKLEAGAQSVIRDKISELLHLLQESYQSDVIGFGNKVAGKYPKLWKKIKNNWRSTFATIPSDIHVKINISGSQESMKVTKVGP
jgi:spore germination protein KC